MVDIDSLFVNTWRSVVYFEKAQNAVFLNGIELFKDKSSDSSTNAEKFWWVASYELQERQQGLKGLGCKVIFLV